MLVFISLFSAFSVWVMVNFRSGVNDENKVGTRLDFKCKNVLDTESGVVGGFHCLKLCSKSGCDTLLVLIFNAVSQLGSK